MGFDGIPRPSQVNPYNNPLNPYTAANAAGADRAAWPLVKGLSKEEQVKGLQEDHHRHREEDEDEQHKPFTPEEAEEIMLLAKMRGVMNFALDAEVSYEFHMNPETGMVELREVETGKLMLKLTPDEMATLAEKLHRAAGMLADRNG